jgi:hypothetical protein
MIKKTNFTKITALIDVHGELAKLPQFLFYSTFGLT